jgi:hypothetical protein
VRTDIAGFVGYCERGPLPIASDFPDGKFKPEQVALKITSWKQFQANFGGFLPYGYLAYAVRAFFENGGNTCYVARVAAVAADRGSDWPALAAVPLPSVDPRHPVGARFVATSRGSWGNQVQLQITPLDAGSFALRAIVNLGPGIPPAEAEFYRRLSLDPKDPNYAGAILAQQSNLVRLDTGPLPFVQGGALQGGQVSLTGGTDGLAQATVQDFTGGLDDLRGLRLLEAIDEVSILAVPDAVFREPAAPPPPPPPPPDPCDGFPQPKPAGAVNEVHNALNAADGLQVQQAMIDQCQRLRYRVALIDPPDQLQIDTVQTWLFNSGLITRFSLYAALYYPWLKVPDPLQPLGNTRRVPPSGAVAGAYAYNDLTFGVQRPPANLELDWTTDVGQAISDAQQGDLNQNNINALRVFPGRGIRIWGARSLANEDNTEWRFIHVRRLMSAIEETVEHQSRWAVFQNNDNALRASLKHSMEVLLEGIWAAGGLKGGTPAQAFYVKCDSANNPQDVIDRGQLICEVGIAVAAPMEFIVFQIRQDATGTVVEES